MKASLIYKIRGVGYAFGVLIFRGFVHFICIKWEILPGFRAFHAPE